ncbi:MAG TPA: hypothetical protein VK427_20985 [Kofleriaceae bacterium]|nr:hypothetical protein [Kofleriaceae bacterium]
MLEILFLLWFCKTLAAKAREKNRSGRWGALGAILWIGGEIGGATIGFDHAHDPTSIYAFMLLGALLGAAIAYVVVVRLQRHPRAGELPQARVI